MEGQGGECSEDKVGGQTDGGEEEKNKKRETRWKRWRLRVKGRARSGPRGRQQEARGQGAEPREASGAARAGAGGCRQERPRRESAQGLRKMGSQSGEWGAPREGYKGGENKRVVGHEAGERNTGSQRAEANKGEGDQCRWEGVQPA